jgi:hypothetical protein
VRIGCNGEDYSGISGRKPGVEAARRDMATRAAGCIVHLVTRDHIRTEQL